ncbi:hypothetical protein RCJ22_05220, partial [Vibrio sp. FNV 38]|nr:hypothetical protein [Vibrio sp. FNV 38]
MTEPDNMPPTKAEDNDYTYVFDGWDKPIEDVTKNATYTATYKPFKARYTVHHYLYGTDDNPVQVAPDQTGKWEIGKSMTVGKSPDLKPEYADSATVVGYSKGDGEIVISQTIADNEVIVYYKVPLTITA